MLSSGLKSYEVSSFLKSLMPTMVALFMQLAGFVLIARLLRPADFGTYSILSAITAISMEIMGLGSAELMIRAVIRDVDATRPYLGNAIIVSTLALPIVAIALVLIIANAGFSQLPWQVIAFFITSELVVSRLMAIFEALANTRKNIYFANILRMILVGARLLVAVVFFMMVRNVNINTWLLFCGFQSILTTVLSATLIVRRYGTPIWHLVSFEEFRTGLLFAISQVSRAAQGNIDRALLSSFNLGSVLGVYAAASRVIQLGLFPIQIVNRILYPSFFAYGEHGIVRVRQFAVKCVVPAAALGVLTATGVVIASQFAPLLVGREFASISKYVTLLSLSIPFIAIQYPAADALSGCGKQSLRTILTVMSTMVFSAGIVTGALSLGVYGIAIAFLLGHVLIAAALWLTLMLSGRRDEAVA